MTVEYMNLIYNTIRILAYPLHILLKNQTMIKTNQLTKIFRTDEIVTTALNKVNFEVRKGEFVAVMGPSGCGKSTLLNIIGLLDQPTDGQYLFNGIEVSKFREKQRTGLRKGNIGFVFQSFNLIDEPTGNLDSQNGEEVMKLLEELHTEGTSIIMVTHSPAHAERAQRIVHLFDGHIVTENIRG